MSHLIVTGRKRLHAALSLGLQFCDCLKVPADLPYPATFGIVWEEAFYARLPSALEQAICFDKVNQYRSIEEIAERYLPVIGLSPSADYIKKKLAILRLDEPLQIAVHEGRLNEQVCIELGELAFSDRMALFEVIELLKLSSGNQKKLTRSCRELAARNRTTVLSILSRPELAGIINDSGQNIPQKAGRFMKKIQEERYPRLTEAENNFRRFTADLSLPDNITISHAPSFEKDELNLTVTCSGREELQEMLYRIKD